MRNAKTSLAVHPEGKSQVGSLVNMEGVTKCALKKQTAFVAHVRQQ